MARLEKTYTGGEADARTEDPTDAPRYFKVLLEDYRVVRDTLPSAQAAKWMWARMVYFFDHEDAPLPEKLRKSFNITEKNRLDSYRRSVLNGTKNRRENSGVTAWIPEKTAFMGTTQAPTHGIRLGTTLGSTEIKKEELKKEEIKKASGDALRPAQSAARRRTSTSQERTSKSTFLVSSDGPQPEESGRREGEAVPGSTPTTQEEHDLTTVLGSICTPTTMGPEPVKQKEPSKSEAAMLVDLWRRLNKNPDHEMDPAERELYERYKGSRTWREICTGGVV